MRLRIACARIPRQASLQSPPRRLVQILHAPGKNNGRPNHPCKDHHNDQPEHHRRHAEASGQAEACKDRQCHGERPTRPHRSPRIVAATEKIEVPLDESHAQNGTRPGRYADQQARYLISNNDPVVARRSPQRPLNRHGNQRHRDHQSDQTNLHRQRHTQSLLCSSHFGDPGHGARQTGETPPSHAPSHQRKQQSASPHSSRDLQGHSSRCTSHHANHHQYEPNQHSAERQMDTPYHRFRGNDQCTQILDLDVQLKITPIRLANPHAALGTYSSTLQSRQFVLTSTAHHTLRHLTVRRLALRLGNELIVTPQHVPPLAQHSGTSSTPASGRCGWSRSGGSRRGGASSRGSARGGA